MTMVDFDVDNKIITLTILTYVFVSGNPKTFRTIGSQLWI